MKDSFGREIDYLRLSVTDRCNLRCVYCMGEDGVDWKPHGEMLTFEELRRLCHIFAGLGIKKIKITGGEPLVKKGVLPFIAHIRTIPGIEDVTLTTNGVLLGSHLDTLIASGISAVNISLDSFRRETFRRLSGRDEFARVLSSLHTAINMHNEKCKEGVSAPVEQNPYNKGGSLPHAPVLRPPLPPLRGPAPATPPPPAVEANGTAGNRNTPVPLRGNASPLPSAVESNRTAEDCDTPVPLRGNASTPNTAPAQKLRIKINMVPLRGINDGEIADFALFARDHDVSVRFIELMPLGFAAAYTMVPNGEALEQIMRVIKDLAPVAEIQGNGPAVYYTSPDMKGDIGFISAVSSCFCASCNRLRLDSLGRLKPCLSSDLFCDLKALVRGGADDDVIKDAILNTVALKPRAHVFADTANTTLRRTNMFKIGG